MLVPFSMPAVVMLIAMCAVTMLGRRDLSFVRPVDATAAPLHEWVAVVGLMLLPLLGAIVAQLITGGYMPRYGIAWVLGFSITTAFVAATVSTTKGDGGGGTRDASRLDVGENDAFGKTPSRRAAHDCADQCRTPRHARRFTANCRHARTRVLSTCRIRAA